MCGSDEDCSAVRYVCECVSRRAGFLVSAGITALLKKMDYKESFVILICVIIPNHKKIFLTMTDMSSENPI